MFHLNTYLKERKTIIDKALAQSLPKVRQTPASIHKAMRYSVLGEGKRIRPVLVLAGCEAVGGKVESALHAACAMELIHAYSLVHDDLPAMDDDDFRRGKPSCHKAFGEGLAVLTGDALLTYAFELLTTGRQDATVQLKVLQEVAQAIGTDGMIGGQVLDIEVEDADATLKQMEAVHVRKTGALIAASVRIGALLGGAKGKTYEGLATYGAKIGLVFQLIDDLLDGDGFVQIQGEDAVRQKAKRLTQTGLKAIESLGPKAEPLRELALYLLTRGS